MRQLFFVLIAALFLISAKSPDAEGIEFFRGSFTSAKLKAAEEGKLFFLDFTASWCTPCRWMEQTTFTDPALAAYVKESYVALKVDIDDFDGYALKQEYGIQILPSLLIFSSKGELLGQYEESLSPNNMMAILKKYDLPKNRTITRRTTNYATTNSYVPTNNYNATIQPIKSNPAFKEMKLPSTIMVNNTEVNSTPTVDYTSNRPTSVGNISRKKLVRKERKLVSIPESKETIKPYLHNTAAPTSYYNNTVTNRPAAVNETFEKPSSHLPSLNSTMDDGTGLYRFQVQRQPSQGYSIQVGAYAEYGNVLSQASIMQQHFSEPVIVHISKNRNRTLYKLMLGEFQTRNAAINFMRTVQAKGVECMIKNLSTH